VGIRHVVWWSQGGPTNLDNLIPLCKHHHLFVHDHGYTIQIGSDADGRPLTGPRRWIFLSPRGTPIPDHRQVLQRYLEQLTVLSRELRAEPVGVAQPVASGGWREVVAVT
jgi:HNH endonuclease